jgi:hypothetical protein
MSVPKLGMPNWACPKMRQIELPLTINMGLLAGMASASLNHALKSMDFDFHPIPKRRNGSFRYEWGRKVNPQDKHL